MRARNASLIIGGRCGPQRRGESRGEKEGRDDLHEPHQNPVSDPSSNWTPKPNCRDVVKGWLGGEKCTHNLLCALLIIDDDTELCQPVVDYLKPMRLRGRNGARRRARSRNATSEPWAAVILDVMMPGCDGVLLMHPCKIEGACHDASPVAGEGGAGTASSALNSGCADDSPAEDLSPRELLARLRAPLRRTGWIAGDSRKPRQRTSHRRTGESILKRTMSSSATSLCSFHARRVRPPCHSLRPTAAWKPANSPYRGGR